MVVVVMVAAVTLVLQYSTCPMNLPYQRQQLIRLVAVQALHRRDRWVCEQLVRQLVLPHLSEIA